MKNFFIICSLNLFAVILGLGSIYLAIHSNNAWPWFLVAGVLSRVSVENAYLENIHKDDE
jgi:hypothetical protein